MVVWLCHARVAHRQAPIKRNPSYVCAGDFLHLGIRKSPVMAAVFHYSPVIAAQAVIPFHLLRTNRSTYTIYQYTKEITASAAMTIKYSDDDKV